jgi:hypothetical protein
VGGVGAQHDHAACALRDKAQDLRGRLAGAGGDAGAVVEVLLPQMHAARQVGSGNVARGVVDQAQGRVLDLAQHPRDRQGGERRLRAVERDNDGGGGHGSRLSGPAGGGGKSEPVPASPPLEPHGKVAPGWRQVGVMHQAVARS